MCSKPKLDLQKVRAQFPALKQTVHGKPLIYLDNAATTQKPQVVLDALASYYLHDTANVHRGIHTLSDRATNGLEATRQALKQFIHARDVSEIIFTAGATASINLVASTYGQIRVQAGDEIILSHMEHHANIVPWQMLCQAKGATLKVIPVSERGELLLTELEKLLTSRTKVVAVSYASNTLGTVNPVKAVIQLAHSKNAVAVIDGAQAIPHLPINVQDLDCDFFAFSAHKAYGPSGVGALYGKKELLEIMPPYQGGGAMVDRVTFSAHTTYNDIPYKFEAGTPHIAGIVAWQQALHFIQKIGYENLRVHEDRLLHHALGLLSSLNNVRVVGTAPDRIGILSLVLKGIHSLDAGMLLDARGIAVRTGHSCTQPLMDLLGIEGVVRASFAVYNTVEEVEQFVEEIARIAQHKS